jgi:hypothetical protein
VVERARERENEDFRSVSSRERNGMAEGGFTSTYSLGFLLTSASVVCVWWQV